jgi:hypothetical protein
MGDYPVVGHGRPGSVRRGGLCVAERADRCAMSGVNQAVCPGPPDLGSRSIAHIGGDDPAWRTSMTLNP